MSCLFHTLLFAQMSSTFFLRCFEWTLFLFPVLWGLVLRSRPELYFQLRRIWTRSFPKSPCSNEPHSSTWGRELVDGLSQGLWSPENTKLTVRCLIPWWSRREKTKQQCSRSTSICFISDFSGPRSLNPAVVSPFTFSSTLRTWWRSSSTWGWIWRRSSC